MAGAEMRRFGLQANEGILLASAGALGLRLGGPLHHGDARSQQDLRCRR